MATDTTHLPQGELSSDSGADMAGTELEFGAVQLAAATDGAGQPVQLPQGQRVVLVPVQPGQTLTLPTDSAANLLAKIGPEGNLAIVVDGRIIILQGYVAANEQAPVRILTTDGEEVDAADLVAATDPALDIQTAAGPAAGDQGDATGSGIFTPFVPGAGPGLIGAEGVLGATELGYKLIDDERRLFTRDEDTGPTSIDIVFDVLDGVINEDDLPAEQRGQETFRSEFVLQDVGNDGAGNDPFDTKDREPGSQNNPPDEDDVDDNGTGADGDREPLRTVATVTVTFGDDIPGTLKLDDSELPAGLTSEGEPIIYQVLPAGGGQGNGIVAFVDGDGDGKFNEFLDRKIFDVKVQEDKSDSVFHVVFTVYDNIDNEAPDGNDDGIADLLGSNEQILGLPVKVTATDSDGSSLSTVMNLGVEDDIPFFGQVNLTEGSGGILLTIEDTDAAINHDETKGVDGGSDDVSYQDAGAYADAANQKVAAAGFSLPYGDSVGATKGFALAQVQASFGADGATQETYKSDDVARNSIFGALEDRLNADGDGIADGENERPFELFMIATGSGANAVPAEDNLNTVAVEGNLTIADQKTNATVTWNGVELPIYLHQVDAQTIIGYVEPGLQVPQNAAAIAVESGQEAVFVLTIDDNGVLTFVQYHQINHAIDGDNSNGEHDDTFQILGEDGTPVIQVRISDFDGDHATQPVVLEIEDDGPKFCETKFITHCDIDADWTIINGEVVGAVDEDWLKGGNKGLDFAAGDNSLLDGVSTDGVILFTFGTDKPGTLSIGGLTITDSKGNDVPLDSLTTADGKPVLIEQSAADGDGVVTYRGYAEDGKGGTIPVFTFTIDTAGDDIGAFEFTLQAPLEHEYQDPDFANDGPQTRYEDDLLFDFTIIGKDVDGDTAEGHVKVNVDDDVPVVVNNYLSSFTLRTDETVGGNGDVNANGSGSKDGPYAENDESLVALPASLTDAAYGAVIGAGVASTANLFIVNGGGDGTFSSVFTLNITGGGNTGLVDTLTGQPVTLVQNGAVIEGRTGSGAVVLALTIDATTGEVSMAQYRAINHSDDDPNSYPDEIKSILDGKLSVTLTVTDNDGDSASATRDISGGIKIEDDGPSVTLVSGATISLNVDETVGGDGTDLDTYHPNGKEDGPTIENDEDLIGSLPTSITSYGTVIGADVAQASALFSYNAGSDGEAFHSYNLVFKSGADTGLIDVATGQPVKIYDGSGTLYGVNTNGDFVFAITINHNTGEVTIGQFRALDHGDEEGEFGAPDEMLAIKDGVLSVELVVTDKDGDVASVSKDIGSSITFDDDGPKAELVTIDIESKAGDGLLIHDETTGDDGDDDVAGPLAVFAGVEASKSLTAIGYAQTIVNVDLSGGTGNPNAAYGSDGAGTTALSLTGAGGVTLFGAATNLTDTATGQPIFLFAIGNGVVVGVLGNDPNGTVAFALAIDNAGNLSLAQYRAIAHPEAGDEASGNHDDPVTLLASVNGEAAVFISAIVTDQDGDSVRVSVPLDGKDGNGAIIFEDDGPSTDLTLGSGASLILDESVGAPGLGEPADANANDEAGNVDGDIAYATISAGALFSEVTSYGADGKAGSEERVFSLVVKDSESGLVDSESNQAIVLVDKGNGVVEGHVGTADGALSFRVTVDTATGDVTVSQFRAVEHDNAADADESASPEIMDADTLLLQLTVKDGDLDTDSDTIDLGAIIKFEDDGPIARDDVDTIETADDGATFFASGNVISGADTTVAGVDDGGSDKVAVISKLQSVTQDSDPDGGFVANGVFGTLTMDTQGNYTYDFDETNWLGKVPSGSTEVFTYTYKDSDGDTDIATLTINLGDATVSTSAVVNPGGASFIKEDVETPLALTATPGAGDRVTQIVLDDIPAGWTVNQAGIALSSGTIGSVTLVGDTLTINITGAAPGVAVTATVPVTPAEDSDVDGDNLVVQATVVDGVVFASNSATFDVTVDAILDEYLDVTAGAIAPLTESASQQVVGLNLSSAFAATPYANALAGGSDGDGSEWVPLTVQITVSGDVADLQLAAPIAGVTLGEGVPGTWLLNADSLANLQSALATLQAIVPAGFDGTISGSILAWTRESNTPQGSVPASGNEPDLADNVYEDLTDFSIVVTPSTTVTTSAVVGTQGAAYLKEDVFGPIALTATPGATDKVTQIVLSNVPAGWDVKDDSLADFTIVGGTIVGTPVYDAVNHTITFDITGAAVGVPVTVTVQVKANEDSDVDGLNLNVAATAVDNDGGESTTNNTNFNVTVDAILDQYLDVTAGPIAPLAESGSQQVVGLNLSSAFATTSFANALAGGADGDGSEKVSLIATITVTGDAVNLTMVGAIGGVSFAEGPAGTWTMTAPDAASLQLALSLVQAVVPAGYDGIITGSVSVTTAEANTPQGTVPASGNEPDLNDNTQTDITPFSILVTPSTTVTASAVVGTEGAAFLKEDVYGPISLTATPGATDYVTQIVLSNIPDGWDVKDASLADFTVVGGTIVGTPVFDEVTHSIIFDISGAGLGAPVTVTMQVKAVEDSDVDGLNLHVAATAVDGDGGETAFAGSDFNVVVDAVLDRYLDVSQSAAPSVAESAGSQTVNLNLTSALAGGAGNPFTHSDAGGTDDDNSENLPTQLIIQIAAPNQAIDLTLGAGAPASVTLTEFAPDTGVWFLNATNGLDLQLAMTFVQAVVPAGFDGTITGQLSATTSEANTPQGAAPASGNEPDTSDNFYNDLTDFSIVVTPSTTVTTSAVVGTQGAAYLKEDVFGPIALTATPGATDKVTQIVLSNVPAGWDVKDDSLADFTIVGGTIVGTPVYDAVNHTITFDITGAAVGVPVTVTVLVKASEDSDVDGLNLNVAATAVDNDGGESTTNNTNFNVTVDAILDQYLDVSQGAVAPLTESGSQQVVGLNLSSAFATAAFANALAGGPDGDSSEVVNLSVTITVTGDVADLQLAAAIAGVTLTEGVAGSWTLTADTLANLQSAISTLQAVVPAGFDGSISGSISVGTAEANTPQGSAPASGNEPDVTDNAQTDITPFSIAVNPSTTVTTSAVVGTEGAAFLKEDVYGPITLTATPGATDHVTQIVLSNVPAGWDVKDDSNADFQIVGGSIVGTPIYNAVTHTITFDVTGTTDGVPVSITVLVKANEDSDVDGLNLNVAATVVDGDGGESTSNSSNFNVTVDAVLDAYAGVLQIVAPTVAESAVNQNVGLGLLTQFNVAPFTYSFEGANDGDGSEIAPTSAIVTLPNLAIDLALPGGLPVTTLLTETDPGVWTISAASWSDLHNAIVGLQAVVPAGFDGTINGSIKLVTKEANTPEGSVPGSGLEPDLSDNVRESERPFSVTVTNSHNTTISGDVGVAEDAIFNQYDQTLAQTVAPAQISFAGVVTLGVGEALTALTITGIPAGATVTINGVTVTNGVALTSGQLADWIGGTPMLVTPPANADIDFTLALSGQTTDSSSSAVSPVSGNVLVRVDAAADDPTGVSIDAVSTSGDEQFLASETGTVKITANFGDLADGTEAHSLTITAPAGFVITSVANLDGLVIGNFSGLGTGTVTVTVPGGDAGVSNLVLNVQAPANYVGPNPPTFQVTATAVDTPTDQGTGAGNVDNPVNNTASETATDAVSFLNDPAEGTTSAAVCVKEDSRPNQYLGDFATIASGTVNFSLLAADNEQFVSVTVNNIPLGVTISDGTQSVVGTGANSITILAANLGTVTLTQPNNDDANDYTLSYTAQIVDPTSSETATINGSLAVTVDAVADQPTALDTTVSPRGFAYSVAESKDTGEATLFRIDLDSGAVKEVGSVTIPGSTQPDIEGLAFNAGSGLLYGFVTGPGTNKFLVSIDPATATTTVIGGATPVGEMGTEFVGNTLYAVVASGNTSQLYTVNTTTGAFTAVGGTTGANVSIDGLAYNSDTGKMYGLDKDGTSTYLYEINLATGVASNPVLVGTNLDLQNLAYGLDEKLWAVDRGTGAVYQISTSGGATLVSTVPVSFFQGDGFESLAITPNLTGSVDAGSKFGFGFTADFGDFTDGSEDHTILIKLPDATWDDAATAPAPTVLAGGNSYGVPAGTYLIIDADALIDPSTGIATGSVLLSAPAGASGSQNFTVYAVAKDGELPGDTVDPACEIEGNNLSVVSTVQSVNITANYVPNAVDDGKTAENVTTNYQLMLVLDGSTSMNEIVPNSGGKTRYELARDSLIALIESYQGSTTGNVQVKIVGFGSSASYMGGTSGAFIDAAAAIAMLQGLNTTIGSINYTDYDDALYQAKLGIDNGSWANSSASTKSFVYWVSDGRPTDSDGSSPFGASGSAANPINDYEQTQWQNSLDAKGVTSIAIGIGSDIVGDPQVTDQLGRVAYTPGGGADQVLIIDNINNLSAALVSTVPAPVSGNLMGNDTAGDPSDPLVGGVVSMLDLSNPDAPAAAVQDLVTQWKIETNLGILIVDKAYPGNYTYTPKPGSEGHVDTFQYTIQDTNGADTDTAVLTITIAGAGQTVNGTGSADTLRGGLGNDTLDGKGGNDVLWGGDGDDIIKGDTGNDTLFGGAGNDSLQGGADVDAYIFLPGNGDDTVIDTGGSDRINLLGGPTALDAANVGGDLVIRYGLNGLSDKITVVDHFDVAGNKMETIEIIDGPFSGVYTISTDATGTLDGSDGVNDFVAGTSAGQTLNGGTGNDLLFGAGGIDTLNGGSGNDLLVGGADGVVDQLNGGSGNDHYIIDESGVALDVVSESSGNGTDTVWASVDYSLTANVENLNLTGTGNINGTGNSSDNVITGNAGNNTLNGGSGDDTLHGGGGIDTLNGDGGDDVLFFQGVGSTYNGGANDSNPLSGSNAGDILDISSAVTLDLDNLLGGGIETLRMNGGSTNAVTLDAGDVLSLSSGTFDHDNSGGTAAKTALRIDGDASGSTSNQDYVTLETDGVGKWWNIDSKSSEPSGYHVYAYDADGGVTYGAGQVTAVVIIQDDIIVTGSSGNA